MNTKVKTRHYLWALKYTKENYMTSIFKWVLTTFSRVADLCRNNRISVILNQVSSTLVTTYKPSAAQGLGCRLWAQSSPPDRILAFHPLMFVFLQVKWYWIWITAEQWGRISPRISCNSTHVYLLGIWIHNELPGCPRQQELQREQQRRWRKEQRGGETLLADGLFSRVRN